MSAEITALERAFEFEDQHFRNFMTAGNMKPHNYLAHHEAMVEADHPVVLMAAGWALAEYASFRRPTNSGNLIRLNSRLAAIEQARATWQRVDFSSLQDAQPNEAKYLDVRDMEMRRRQAIGHLPILQVAAHWQSGEALDAQAIEEKMREARGQVAEVAAEVQNLPHKTDLEKRHRAGLVSEFACGIVINNDPLHRYLGLPSSIRLDHHPDPKRRTDFIAVSAEKPHRRTNMDIKSNGQHLTHRGAVFQVIANRDLVIDPATPVHRTLEILLHQEAGTNISYDAIVLGAVTERLVQRLDRFQARFVRR